ncbi:MAG: GTPase HflX [Patescibacteria group bacterium]|nr:GTPase HflX [Patescibacteria group bacterium]
MLSSKPRAILIDVIPPRMPDKEAKRRIYELENLTQTYGGIVVVKIIQKRAIPDYKTFIGSGKLEDVVVIAKEEKVELIVVNNILKPHQIFNIERRVEKERIAVWDRIDMILKIFQKHATTIEAKLQIRLAGIRHMGPRIFRMGLELGQQQGGIGVRGGGETNIEIMKRHLAEQERSIKNQLAKISNTRGQHRARRDRLGLKTVSIVGYTNAGKSSLLNALTRKGAYVADELFATLDTRVAKLWLPRSPMPPLTRGSDSVVQDVVRDARDVRQVRSLLLSDTIGFIQDLPPQLIDAFKSTLEETIEAELILHVIDVSDPFVHEKIEEVEKILDQLGVSKTPKIYVFNKTDLVKRIPKASLLKKYKKMTPVFVSALKGEGLEELKNQLSLRILPQV